MTEVLAERKIWWFGRLKTVRVSKPDPRGSTKLLAYWIENDRGPHSGGVGYRGDAMLKVD